MIAAGIDAGSRTIKVCLLGAGTLEPVAWGLADQGVEQEALARRLFDKVLADHDIAPDRVTCTVATGYGRNILSFADKVVTEITCQARGVRRLAPEAMTIVDIGGQDSKVIRLEADGAVRDFAMNERCAAGTGRFLEIVADRLGVTLDALGDMAAASASPATVTSTCAVFAETEIVSLLATGTARDDIAAGVQAALASRVHTMAGGRNEAPIYFTGGVALLHGMVRALEAAFGEHVSAAPRPQFTAALGAALIAAANTAPEEARHGRRP